MQREHRLRSTSSEDAGWYRVLSRAAGVLPSCKPEPQTADNKHIIFCPAGVVFYETFFQGWRLLRRSHWNKTNKHKKTVDMKKLLLIILTLGFAGSLALNAADAPKKKGMTAEQKKLYKEMVEKYDENKNGRLDKAERSKMSAEDQKKMEEAGIGGKKKKAE